jgi:hypothetical protein
MIGKLQKEYRKLQDRIDAMYVDKLDAKIAQEFFDRKNSDWRTEQTEILGKNRETPECKLVLLKRGYSASRTRSKGCQSLRKTRNEGKTTHSRFSILGLPLERRRSGP